MKTSTTLRQLKRYLGKEVEIVIDRSFGSKHPRFEFLYKANYGYIPNTKAPDGGELDAYYLGVEKPLKKAKGVGVAIIHRINDDDDRLVIIPDNKENMSDEEIKKLVDFQEKFAKYKIVR